MADPDNTKETVEQRAKIAEAARYYARADEKTTNPKGWASLTIVGPIVGTALALGLLSAINLRGPQGTAYAGLTQKTVRTAIHDALTKDLSAERIQAVLLDAKDKAPVAPATDKPAKAGTKKPAQKPAAPAPTPEQITKRKTERTERFKPVGARVAAEVGRLSDTLAKEALADHLSAQNSTAVKDEASIRGAAKVVTARLSTEAIAEKAKAWAASALDPYNAASAREMLADGVALDERIASLVDAAAVQAAVERAVTPSVDPADVRPAAATWAADIGGRLAWAIAALVFCLALIVVMLNAASQIFMIKPEERNGFVVSSVVFAAFALVATSIALAAVPVLQGPEPLHAALVRYADLYGLAMVLWSQVLTALTAVGGVALIVGAVATLWVKIANKDELAEQLRGFRALFNAGAILLFFGVLEITALFRWPTLFIGDDVVRAAMQGAAATYAAAVGALFSVLLLATYVPATAALRRQAIVSGVTTKEVADAMKDAGFGDLALQQVGRLAQVFAPLVPGVISILLTTT